MRKPCPLYPRKRTCGVQLMLILTPNVLDGFPFLECSLDCNKILMLGIFGMLFDGRTGPSKPSAPSAASRVFRKNLGQGFGELLIKNGNIGGAVHVRTLVQGEYRTIYGTRRSAPWDTLTREG